MKKQRMFPLLLIILLVVLDQISKYFFYDQELRSSLPFLEPLLNTGISWGIQISAPLIIGISLVCVVLFGYLYYKKFLSFWEISLFIAGTVGNLLDRFFWGGVRDFISLGNFPVFNLADAFLTAAVALLCIREFFLLKRPKKKLDSTE